MTKEQVCDLTKQIDALLTIARDESIMLDNSRYIPGMPNYKREMEFIETKLEEAGLWAGRCLKRFEDYDTR